MEEDSMQYDGRYNNTRTDQVRDAPTLEAICVQESDISITLTAKETDEMQSDKTSKAIPLPATLSHPKERIRELARHARYRLKDDVAVTLKVTSGNGKSWTADVLNCSITGALVRTTQPTETAISPQQILTDVRLHIGEIKYPLGRLNVQRIESHDSGAGTTIALSMIDRRITHPPLCQF